MIWFEGLSRLVRARHTPRPTWRSGCARMGEIYGRNQRTSVRSRTQSLDLAERRRDRVAVVLEEGAHLCSGWRRIDVVHQNQGRPVGGDVVVHAAAPDALDFQALNAALLRGPWSGRVERTPTPTCRRGPSRPGSLAPPYRWRVARRRARHLLHGSSSSSKCRVHHPSHVPSRARRRRSADPGVDHRR